LKFFQNGLGYFFRVRVLTRNHTINNQKLITMKKLMLVLAIGAFAACNNSASTESKADSTKMDSTKMAPDTTKHDSTSMAKPDSTKKDTATKK
jgi:hypothetical protein